MGTFLIQLGTMSIQASVAILVVLVLRKFFAAIGVSKKYVMLLWMIPFLLLVCPWKISVSVGFWNVAPSDYDEQYTEYALERWQAQGEVLGETGAAIDHEMVVEPGIEENADKGYHIAESDVSLLQILLYVAAGIWLTGTMTFLLYAAVSYALLKKSVRCCVRKADAVYCVDDLPVPIIVGFLKPQIYLPSGMKDEYVDYVVEHEKTHIRRKDPITKLIAYTIACVHWFNPLVWVAYHFLEKDMEMTCDEETLWRIGIGQKKEYATALLQLSVGKRKVVAVPIAFGEGDTKGRIKNVMHYKKTMRSAAILAVVLGVLVFVVFMTKRDADFVMINNPQEQTEKGEIEEQGMSGDAENSETMYQSSEEENELTFDMVREAAANHTLHELDFHSFSNGEEWYFEDRNVLNYYIDFHYDYEGEVYEISASHRLENDALWGVYATRESDGEMRWLYRDEDGIDEYSDYLEPLLATKENVGEWLSVELPEGYSLGTYQAHRGWAGGALISPQAYELYGDDVFAPEEWYYAGFVGQIPDADEVFGFENGKLVDGAINVWNHSSYEKLDVLDLDWQALFVHYNHDLYTAAGQAWLEEDGVDISQIDTTSDYWYFFFAKEGEEKAYYLSLSQKFFTKEEAIAIAKTVDIRE